MTYTPESFAASLGLDFDDYVSITSFTHHPFYTEFPVEVQDNWRQPGSWNLPIDEMARVIDSAIENGYTVAWGGDVSEDGFTRKGLALLYDTENPDLEGSDMAHWLKMSAAEKANKLKDQGVYIKEVTPTQEQRQKDFDDWSLTDDHGMLIFGIAKDQWGNKYYMVKNSWGESGNYKGIYYVTPEFVRAKTMNVTVNKAAVSKNFRDKYGF